MTIRNLVRLSLTIAFAVPALVSAATSTWDVDGVHSTIGFKVKHLMVSNARGSFKEFKGTITTDDKDVTKTAVEITINPATVDTAEPKRDDHLRSADFFDVANHKAILFKSKKVVKGKGTSFKLVGDLTMHGVTKEVTFDVAEFTGPQTAPSGKLVRGLSATGSVNRKDFNMTWNKTLDKGGLALSDKVDINVELELIEQAKTEEKKS